VAPSPSSSNRVFQEAPRSLAIVSALAGQVQRASASLRQALRLIKYQNLFGYSPPLPVYAEAPSKFHRQRSGAQAQSCFGTLALCERAQRNLIRPGKVGCLPIILLGGRHGCDANPQSRKYRECHGPSPSSDSGHASDRAVWGTFFFDLVFWQTGNDVFARGALWLLGLGLIGAALAAVAGLIDFLGDERIRALGDAWQHAIGNVILVLVQLFSFYHRYRYGSSAVVPLGLSLSVIALLIMLFTGWKGGELVFRHRVAVYDEPRP
jgi:uncharacterized membrane protein